MKYYIVSRGMYLQVKTLEDRQVDCNIDKPCFVRYKISRAGYLIEEIFTVENGKNQVMQSICYKHFYTDKSKCIHACFLKLDSSMKSLEKRMVRVLMAMESLKYVQMEVAIEGECEGINSNVPAVETLSE